MKKRLMIVLLVLLYSFGISVTPTYASSTGSFVLKDVTVDDNNVFHVVGETKDVKGNFKDYLAQIYLCSRKNGGVYKNTALAYWFMHGITEPNYSLTAMIGPTNFYGYGRGMDYEGASGLCYFQGYLLGTKHTLLYDVSDIDICSSAKLFKYIDFTGEKIKMYDYNCSKYGHNYNNVLAKKATTKKNGRIAYKCDVCGKIKKNVKIYKLKTVKLKTTKYKYDGEVKHPKVIIKDSKGNKISKRYYKIKDPYAYSKGKHCIKVIFKNKYKGVKKLYFRIK